MHQPVGADSVRLDVVLGGTRRNNKTYSGDTTINKVGIKQINRGTDGCVRWNLAVVNTWRVRDVGTKIGHMHSRLSCGVMVGW